MDLFEEFGRLFVELGPFMETINDDDDDLFLLLQYLFRHSGVFPTEKFFSSRLKVLNT
jgi:hypothetical protein